MALSETNLKDWILVLLIGAVLIAYVVVFVPDILRTWRKLPPSENEARTYIWSSLGAVIGGVTAFYLGVDLPKSLSSFADWNPPSTEVMRATYSVVYVISGLAALVTWYARTEYSSALLKNSATTFGGLALAVVSSRLLPPA